MEPTAPSSAGSAPCEEPCKTGCDLACEVRSTWLPDPERVFMKHSRMEHGPGRVFKPDGKGGGILYRRSKTTKRYIEDAIVRPYGA